MNWAYSYRNVNFLAQTFAASQIILAASVYVLCKQKDNF